MPRDYKSRSTPRTRNKIASPCWFWFLSGVLLGLFGAALIWLKMPHNGQTTAPSPAPATAADSAATEGTARPEDGTAPPPRFDFYTLLPEMEVVIPEEELNEPAPPKVIQRHTAAKPQPGKGETYLLQIGSFRKRTDAERMKARLALLDIPVQIQRVTINNKDTFHRVRSGPYSRGARLNELRTRLQRNNIKHMVIRLK